MLSCREVTEAASDYLEQELGSWARLQLRMHLAMCRHCRRYMRQLKAAIGLLRHISVEAASSGTEELLLGKLRTSRAHASAATSSGDRSACRSPISRTRE